MTFYMGLAIAT